MNSMREDGQPENRARCIMLGMKPQQLARLLDVDTSTIRRWAREDFRQFLSPLGQGMNGGHRSFSDQDARIIAWIALMRRQNMPPKDISATLHAAQLAGWRDLPSLPGGIADGEPVALVPREAVEERVRALEEQFRLRIETYLNERAVLQENFARERAALQAKIDDLKTEAARERQRAETEGQRADEAQRTLAKLQADWFALSRQYIDLIAQLSISRNK